MPKLYTYYLLGSSLHLAGWKSNLERHLTAMLNYYLLTGLGLACLCAFAVLPCLTGYCAASYGRSFWLWFGLGWVLPIASFLILFALIARRQFDQGERLLDEARAILEAAEKAEVERHR